MEIWSDYLFVVTGAELTGIHVRHSQSAPPKNVMVRDPRTHLQDTTPKPSSKSTVRVSKTLERPRASQAPRPPPKIRLRNLRSSASVHPTISKDHTEGGDKRNAALLAAFGQRLNMSRQHKQRNRQQSRPLERTSSLDGVNKSQPESRPPGPNHLRKYPGYTDVSANFGRRDKRKDWPEYSFTGT